MSSIPSLSLVSHPHFPPPTGHAQYLIGFPSVVCDLDLSEALKLKKVEFEFHIDHFESVTAALNKITAKHVNLKQVSVHVRSTFY